MAGVSQVRAPPVQRSTRGVLTSLADELAAAVAMAAAEIAGEQLVVRTEARICAARSRLARSIEEAQSYCFRRTDRCLEKKNLFSGRRSETTGTVYTGAIVHVLVRVVFKYHGSIKDFCCRSTSTYYTTTVQS